MGATLFSRKNSQPKSGKDNRYKRSCIVASLVSHSKSEGLLGRPCGQHLFKVAPIRSRPLKGLLSPLRYRRMSTGHPSSHCKLQADLDGPGGEAVFQVGKPSHVVDANQLQYVLDADAVLHIGCVGEELGVGGQQV